MGLSGKCEQMFLAQKRHYQNYFGVLIGAEKVRAVSYAKHRFAQLERQKSVIFGRLVRTNIDSE